MCQIKIKYKLSLGAKQLTKKVKRQTDKGTNKQSDFQRNTKKERLTKILKITVNTITIL